MVKYLLLAPHSYHDFSVKREKSYLHTTYAEQDHQKLNEPIWHEFVKYDQEAWSNDNKQDSWCCIDVQNTTNTHSFVIWNFIHNILHEEDRIINQ